MSVLDSTGGMVSHYLSVKDLCREEVSGCQHLEKETMIGAFSYSVSIHTETRGRLCQLSEPDHGTVCSIPIKSG